MATIETQSVGRLRAQETVKHRRRRTENTRFQTTLVCLKGFGTVGSGLRPYSLARTCVSLSPMILGDPGLLSKPVIFKSIFDERAKHTVHFYCTGLLRVLFRY